MPDIIIKDSSDTSDESLKFFKKNYEFFKPIKKLTVFFNSENFLLTPYIIDNEFTHMVLENWDGQEMYINAMNCGYEGTGPFTTVKLLKTLGMEEKRAKELVKHEGLQIGFTHDGTIDENNIKKEVFFGREIGHEKYKFVVNDYAYIDIIERKIYILNPQLTNFKEMLNSIDVMKPREIEYFIGKNSSMENYFRFNNNFTMLRGNDFKYDYKKIKGAKEVNLIIRSELFSIICLLKRSDLMIFLDAIYLYIFKENLFKHKVIGNYCTLTSAKNFTFKEDIIVYIMSKIFHKKEQNVHAVIKIERKNGEMKKWKLYV